MQLNMGYEAAVAGNGFDNEVVEWDGLMGTFARKNNVDPFLIEDNYYGSKRTCVIDMDADGYPDRLIACTDATKNYYLIQKGNGIGFEEPERWPVDNSWRGSDEKMWILIDGYNYLEKFPYHTNVFVDMDGDGKPDRVSFVVDDANQTKN